MEAQICALALSILAGLVGFVLWVLSKAAEGKPWWNKLGFWGKVTVCIVLVVVAGALAVLVAKALACEGAPSWEEGIRIVVLAVVYFLFNGYRYERSQRKQLEAKVEDLTWKR